MIAILYFNTKLYLPQQQKIIKLIFTTIDSEVKGFTNKMGIMKKSFADIKRDFGNGKSGTQASQGFFTSVFGGKNITKNDISAIRKFDEAYKSGIGTGNAWQNTMQNCTVAAKKQAAQCVKSKGSLSELASELEKTTVASKATAVGFKALSIAANVGLMFVVTEVISSIAEFTRASDKLEESAKSLGDTFTSNRSDIESYKEQIQDLYKTINSSSSSFEDVTTARQNLLTIQDEMIEKFGSEAEVVQLVTDAINGQVSALDALSSIQWQETINDFNGNKDKNWKEKLASWYNNLTHGTSNNYETMIKEMEDASVSVDLSNIASSKYQDFLKKLKDIYNLDAVNLDNGKSRVFLDGSLKDVYVELLDIQNLADDMNVGEAISTNFSKVTSETKETLDSYSDIYDQHILQDKILKNEEYASSFNEINDAYEKYQKAFTDGDETAIKDAQTSFTDIIEQAVSNISDDSVVDYLENMYPELQAEIDSWDLKFDVEADTDNTKNDVSLEKLQTNINNFVDAQELANTAIEEFNSTGTVSEETWNSLTTTIPNVKDALVRTATGYQLNTDKLRELNAEQAKNSADKLAKKYDALTKSYNDQSAILASYYYEQRNSSVMTLEHKQNLEQLISAQSSSLDVTAAQIADLDSLGASLDSAMSKYNAFAAAMNSSDSGANYDYITSSIETIKEQFAQGDIGTDQFRAFVDYFTSADMSNASLDDLLDSYDSAIAKAKEWNTEGAEGIYAFYDTLKTYNSVDVVDGSITGIDNLEETAKEAGISVEALQDYLNKLNDKGYQINFDYDNGIVDSADSLKQLYDELDLLEAKKAEMNENGIIDTPKVDTQIEQIKQSIDSMEATITPTVDASNAIEQILEIQSQIDSLTPTTPQFSSLSVINNVDTMNQITELRSQQQAIADQNGINLEATLGVNTDKAEKDIDTVTTQVQDLSDLINEAHNMQISVMDNGQIAQIKNQIDGLVQDRKINLSISTSTPNPVSTKKSSGSGSWQGTAMANGSWKVGTTGKTLVGELGREIVVRGTRYFTVGDNGAEFVNLNSNDIVFNHKQTESLLDAGKINSRGKAMANGSVNSSGSAMATGNISSSFGGSSAANRARQVAEENIAKEAAKTAEATKETSKAAKETTDEDEAQKKALEKIEGKLQKLKSKYNIIESSISRTNDYISLKEIFGFNASSNDYSKIIGNQEKQIRNIEMQNNLLRKQQGIVKKDSKEWWEYQSSIKANEESIVSLTHAMAENAKTSAGLAKSKAEKKNDKIDNSDDFLDSKIENTNSVSKKNKYINSQINNTYKRNANNKTAYNTVLKNKKSTKNKINNLAKTNKTGKYVKLFKEVQTKVKRNAKISASTINNISVALSKESNNRKRSQLNALLIRAINWNELMIAEQEAESAYKIYAQTSIAERKELLQQQRNNLDSKRDDTIERIENNYGASTNNYSYTTSSKNSTLYTMNKQIKAERKAYHSSTVAAANLLKASKKGTYANKTVSSINKAIKAINKLKKKDKKKAAAYKKALNQARSCIKAKKKIPDSILKIIAKNNAGIYERCVNHNSNVDTYNLKAYEESLYYASSLQDYYSNKESFVDNKIAEEDRQDELIEAKKNLVSSAKDKNKYIDAEIQNIKDRLNTYNSEKQKAASNFTDTKRSLTAAYGTTASAKSSTGKKNKKYDTYIQQAISNARAGKEISASTIQKLEAGVNDGVVSVGFVNACNDYNAALQYKESTANEAALYELTSQQDISTKTLEKLQNLSDERHDKYNTDKISTISNLISDDMLFDDKGNATKYFSVKLNLALEGYENAKKDAESYKTDISELEAAYKTGAITAEDYNSKLKELQTSYLNSAESVKNFADEISGYLVNTQQKELETLNKVIDARKKALQQKKEYQDYDKSLKSKTKEINLIKAQIAALEGLTDAESRAQKAKLEAQMQEVQDEIDDAVQEHVYNLQVSGLEDLSDNLQDSYDAYVKELSSNFEKINELIKNLSDTATMSADEVSKAINEILKNYGVDSSIVNVSNTPHMATGGFVKEVKSAGDDGLATLAVGENVLNKELTTLSLKTIPAFNELMENSVLNMLPNPIVNLPELPSATNNMRFRTVEIKPEINFTVEGNVDKFVLEDLKKFQKETVNKTISALAKDLKKIM